MSSKDSIRTNLLEKDVQLLERQTVFKGFLAVEQLALQFRLFSNQWSQNVIRELVHRRPASAVLLYNPWRESVLLTEQFRVGAMSDPVSPWLIELVAGLIDGGESPENAAVRETREEAGVSVLAIRPICRYWTSPGTSDEFVHLFCACVSEEAPIIPLGQLGEGEDIRVKYWTLSEAFEAMESGFINNAPAIIGLQWLQMNHKSLTREWLKLRG